jgi:hypothetical protein
MLDMIRVWNPDATGGAADTHSSLGGRIGGSPVITDGPPGAWSAKVPSIASTGVVSALTRAATVAILRPDRITSTSTTTGPGLPGDK